MRCPKCDGKSRVVETFPDAEEHHRLRACCECGAKFLTREEAVSMDVLCELRRFKNAMRRVKEV